MKKKSFLLRFDYDERTNWMWEDSITVDMLTHLAGVAGRMQTSGAEPQVTVTQLESIDPPNDQCPS